MAKGIFVGLSTIDLVYSVESFPAANSKAVARDQDAFVGGPATNASITFSCLGGEATLVTAVGCHPLTGLIREELERYSIQLKDLNPAFGKLPVISSIYVNQAGERNIVSANATRVNVPRAQLDERICDEATVILADGHYMQAGLLWARAGRTRGRKVILDGGSWKEGMAELLENVDAAICSADFRPPGCSTEEDVLRNLKDRGISEIAITRGAEPIRFLSRESAGSVPVPQVERVDTMGAGDIFHGAFCYYTALGRGFVSALEDASKVAAESCRFRGTREWMRTGSWFKK